MNKILILTLFILLSINTLALTTQVTQLEVNTTIDETITKCIQVTNNQNLTYYNISITNFLHNKIPQLTPSESNNLCFNVTRTNTGTIYFDPIIYGFYPIQYEADVTQHDINLIDISNHTIKQKDLVRFCNTDSIPHTLKELPNGWQITINANQCLYKNVSYTQEIQDLTSMIVGTIYVESNIITQYARNPSTEPQISVKINTFYPNSTIYLKTLPQNHTAPHNKKTMGVLQIKNDGLAVEGIQITGSQWLSFENTTLNLGVNESSFVTFYIQPDINQTFQTDKYYTLNITASVENLKTQSVILNTYVPFYRFENNSYEENGTKIIIRTPTNAEVKEYIKTAPELIEWYCFEDNGTREECIRTQKIYTNLDLNTTMNRRFDKVEEKINTQSTNINALKFEDLKTINDRLNGIEQVQNNLSKNYEEKLKPIAQGEEIRQEEQKNWGTLIITILILMLLIGGGIFGYKYYVKWQSSTKE